LIRNVQFVASIYICHSSITRPLFDDVYARQTFAILGRSDAPGNGGALLYDLFFYCRVFRGLPFAYMNVFINALELQV